MSLLEMARNLGFEKKENPKKSRANADFITGEWQINGITPRLIAEGVWELKQNGVVRYRILIHVSSQGKGAPGGYFLLSEPTPHLVIAATARLLKYKEMKLSKRAGCGTLLEFICSLCSQDQVRDLKNLAKGWNGADEAGANQVLGFIDNLRFTGAS